MILGGNRSGFILGAAGGGPPGADQFKAFNKVCGVGDGPTAGLKTYALAELIGATQFQTFTVNNVPESRDADWTFDGTTITRANDWVPGDRIIGTYKPA